MRVSAHNRVRVKIAVLLEDDTSEPLKVDLVDDTVAWWHDAEVAEGGLTPLEEGESLTVPVELDLLVAVLGIRSASHVDLDGVINNEISLAEWVDFVGISAELRHRCAHSSEVDDGRNASEVLEEHSGRLERNLDGLFRGGFPVENCFNISGCKKI